jgi:competence protein ComEA
MGIGVDNGGNRGMVMAGIVFVSVVAGVFLGSIREDPLPIIDGSATPSNRTLPSSGPIAVHVAGWVSNPGVISLPEGSLVADAISISGGALPGADIDRLNLAQTVRDGDRIEVPGPGGVVAGGGESPSSDLVRLNSADATELERLPGVGPVLAARIVDYREEHGPFGEIEGLLDVPGIGEAKLASIRDFVTIR